MNRRVRVQVAGRVQGVFFRAETERQAHRLGLTGWVRNTPEGLVEAEFQGTSGAVEDAVGYCHEGPPSARVERVTVSDVPVVDGERWFHVR